MTSRLATMMTPKVLRNILLLRQARSSLVRLTSSSTSLATSVSTTRTESNQHPLSATMTSRPLLAHGNRNTTMLSTPRRHLSTTSGTTTSSSSPTRPLSTVAVHDDEHDNNNPNVVPFLLADIGEGIKEVDVLQWNVQVGDKVQQFDSICQVQSDKATVDITSRFAGTIVHVADAGQKVQVGEPLVYIQTEEGDNNNSNASSASTAINATPPRNETPQPAAHPPVTSAQFSTASTVSSNNTSEENVVPFLLADIGEGIKEVEVLQWYVAVGDEVKEFDTICQVQSDKASVEITSRFSGTIVEMNQSSSHIQVGEPLVYIRTVGGAGTSSSSSSTESTLERKQHKDHMEEHQHDSSRLQIPSAASHYALDSDALDTTTTTATTVEASDDDDSSAHDNANVKYLASPAVRKLAADHNINVRAIHGTGPQGRILKADILQYIQTASPAAASATAAPQSKGAAPVPPPTTMPESQPVTEAQPNIVSMTGYNKFMVQSMTDSLQIPHMGLGDEIVVDKLLEFRKQWNASVQDESHKLGMQTLLIKACSMALKEYPTVNAKTHNVEECQVCVHGNHDIGVAMDTPHGLVVPVIRNAESLSLVEIQHELNRLKAAAKTGSIGLSDLSPSPTFSLSNIGAVGVGTHMSPVLVPPMIAMGALGRIQKLPRFDENDNVIATNVLYASWSADHRFLDGATLARFHKAFAKYASDPLQMLPHMK